MYAFWEWYVQRVGSLMRVCGNGVNMKCMTRGLWPCAWYLPVISLNIFACLSHARQPQTSAALSCSCKCLTSRHPLSLHAP